MAITIRDNSAGSSSHGGGLFHSLRDFEPQSERVPPAVPKPSMWQRLGLGRWLHNSNNTSGSSSPTNDHRSYLHRRLSRKVGAVGLPRPTTFRRQNSERRDRLAPDEPEPRRAQSADRRRTLSVQRTQSPAPINIARLSAPEVGSWNEQTLAPRDDDDSVHEYLRDTVTLDSVPYINNTNNNIIQYDDASLNMDGGVEDGLEQELERKWILNLSMHFRDKSEREKFFVTYAEKPNRWRRVTISCDYRDAPPESLEQDLKELHYQRDKSARIYESIRESLPEIQFYDTVTNLKLETSDGRLHVHVTEDVNETIPYPPISSVRHLGGRLIPECNLIFDSHLSGFVYKVRLDGRAYIKKEIPGPDTVDEFLYEINALHALYGSQSVIRFEGIIVDDNREKVKGLLISYAEQGALVDVLYDFRGQLPLARVERWAKQIVQGLCEIHEAGYVQGDFTLSNIVIDGNDNAKIIDINRRGCPVGWEPPEIAAKIESNQRISMYIGVKSDLFQLGMTLWALAMQEDEPERQPRPLFIPVDVKIPDYYRRVIAHCLSDRPRDRLSAKELLSMFPLDIKEQQQQQPVIPPWNVQPTNPPFYDSLQLDAPTHSVCLDDDHHDNRPGVVYVTPAEYEQEVDYPPRGRRPSTHALPPSDYQPSTYLPSSASPNPDGRRSISQSDFEVSNNRPSPDVRGMAIEPRFEEVEVNGTQYLVNPDMFSVEDFEALRDNTHEPHDSQELQSGRSSNLSRAAVVPSSVGDGGAADRDEYQLYDSRLEKVKTGNSDESAGGFQSGGGILGDIVGVGSHPSVSLDHRSTTYLKGDSVDSSLERQSPESPPAAKIRNSLSEMMPQSIKTPRFDEQYTAQTQTAVNESSIQKETSLFASKLPINPANSPRTDEKYVATTTKESSSQQEISLLASKLPINPAKTPRVEEQQYIAQNTTTKSSSQQEASLFSSKLPINPATTPRIDQKHTTPSQTAVDETSSSQQETSEKYVATTIKEESSHQDISLLSSRLPINPAKTPLIDEKYVAQTYTTTTTTAQPQISSHPDASLLASKLPINPAIASPPPPPQQVPVTVKTGNSNSNSSSNNNNLSRISHLLDSVLPINPASSVKPIR